MAFFKWLTGSQDTETPKVEEQVAAPAAEAVIAAEPVAIPEPGVEVVAPPVMAEVMTPEPQPVEAPVVQASAPAAPATETNWWQRLTGGLGKTAQQVNIGIKRAVGLSATLDVATREALEEVLLQADVGYAAASSILDELARRDLPEPLTETAVQTALAEIITARLTRVAPSASFEEKMRQNRPCVVLVAGVNGGGKTTTIGKLAAKWAQEGKTVVVGAADTFRAGAVAQLAVWAERAGTRGSVEIVQPDVSAKGGDSNRAADPAGVAYKAVERGIDLNADVVLIDTAGRLPNRSDLMDELFKIRRVVQKIVPEAPHHTLLVLDGTQGQAVLKQVEGFGPGGVNGLVVTKLDGSGKAGFLLPLAAAPAPLPVYYVGVGEGIEDLGVFEAGAFSRGLLGASSI